MHQFARSLVPRPVRHLLPRTMKRVVVVGGGPTGLFCADRLRHHFEVTVVDAKEYFEFTPSVLRAVVDPSHFTKITFNYRDVLESELGVEFVLGEASKVEVGSVAPGIGAGTVTVTRQSGPHPQRKLHFDYCIVAAGVSNGLWKPRLPREQYTGIGAQALTSMSSSEELTLGGRRATLRALRDRIASARGVVVVGAGLVGVEFVAELVHFFPRLKVTLVDGAPDVLPQLSTGARQYARQWLQAHNVDLRLNKPFSPEGVSSDEVVISCVGARPRAQTLIPETTALRSNGQIRVNQHMQVLYMPSDGKASSVGSSLTSMSDPSTASSLGGSLTSMSDPSYPSQGPTAATRSSADPADKSSVSEPSGGESPRASSGFVPYGQGRIFAVGDAASVQGVPTAQIIYHGEEMAAVAVANIEASEGVASPLNFMKNVRREFEPQPFLCCTSLGPIDGMFSTQTELIATGTLAAIQKQMIEATKVGQLKGDLGCSALWYPVHN